MRPLSLATLAVSVGVVAAHLDAAHHIHRRQAPPPPPPPPSSPPPSSTPATTPNVVATSSPSSPPPAPAPSSSSTRPTTGPSVPSQGPTTIPGTPTIPLTATFTSLPSGPPTDFSYTLAATNPTAVPLSSINANASAVPTIPLPSTYPPGSQPTFLPGAPPLPNAALLDPRNYPALDMTPPTDSPQVQQWIKDVQNSGINIPGFAPTSLGGCAANAAAAADKSRCWWTCDGCTRSTDVTDCPTSFDWGLTYDDGPGFYTSNLLTYLDEVQIKSTFFVVGSRVISFPAILQTEYMRGHQIAVHTWSHASLTTLSNEAIIAELGWSKKVIKDVLGVTPNMMRPPYGDIDDRVRAISLAMGLVPVMWTRLNSVATFDTDDFYLHSGLVSPQQVLYNWELIVGNATTRKSGFIVLEHDLFPQSVEIATGYILPDALGRKPPFKPKPVVTCLNRPLDDAYIETNDNKTNPPPSSPGAVVNVTQGAIGPSTTNKSSTPQSLPIGAGLWSAFLACAAGSAIALLS